MIKNCNYGSKDYPLSVNDYHQLPDYMVHLLNDLCNNFAVVVRGGLAYVIHANDFSYALKDIDLALKKDHKEALIDYLNQEGYLGYLNQNSFGMEVVTLFWEAGEHFNKVDILLTEDDMSYVRMNLPSYSIACNVMTIESLLEDRLKKISGRLKRGHSLDKTYKHLQVVKTICQNPLIDLEKEVFMRLFLDAQLEVDLIFPEESKAFNKILSVLEG